MNIYIPVEVKVRELEGKTLLALAAAERGHTVIIGGKEDTLGLARRGMLKPGILHDKSLTPSATKLEALRELKAGGHVVTSQDEENGLLEVSYERFARLRYSKETCAMAGRILCWGSHDAQGVRNLCGPDAPNTIVATGSPRVDLWRREFSEYYKRTEHLTTGKLGDYVLVSSNLGVMLDFRPFWEEISHLREKYSRDGGELFDEDVEYAYYKEAGWLTCLLSEFIRMIRALAVSEPELRIVVRPHPVEIEEGWRVLIGDYPNVIVTKEGPINRWIRGAKALIHNGSEQQPDRPNPRVNVGWVNRLVWKHFGLMDGVVLGKAVLLATLVVIGTIVYMNRFENYSRAVFVNYGAFLILLLAASRASFRLISEFALRRQRGRRLIVYGAGEQSSMVVRALLDGRVTYQMLGFVDDDHRKHGTRVQGYPVVGGYESLVSRIQGNAVDSVLVSPQVFDAQRLSELGRLCAQHGVSLSRLRFGLEDLVAVS